MGSSGGGGQSGTQTTQSGARIPAWLQPELKQYERGGLDQAFAAQGYLPSITDLYGMTPLQGTAGLTAEQLGTLGQYEGVNGGPNAYEQGGLGTLQNYASGAIGQDPATQAALKQWGQIGSQQAAQQSALSGQANSGAAQEAQAIGMDATLAPYLANSQAQQLSAGGQLFGAGQGIDSQRLNDLAAKLQAEGVPQAQAQQIANNLFNQQQQQFQYASQAQQQPLGLIPSLLGTNTATIQTGHSTQGK